MRDFYIWYCIAAVLVGTGLNYGLTSGSSRSWGNSGSTYSGGGGSWHK